MARRKSKRQADDKFLVAAKSVWDKVQPYFKYVGLGVVAVLVVLAIVAAVKQRFSGEEMRIREEYNRAMSPDPEDLLNPEPQGARPGDLAKLVPEARGSKLEPVIIFDLSKYYLAEKKPEEVIKLLEGRTDLLQGQPLSHALKLVLAQSYLAADKPDRALPLFEDLAKDARGPYSAQASWYAGFCAEKTKQPDLARKYYEAANISTDSPFWAEMAKFRLSKLGSS